MYPKNNIEALKEQKSISFFDFNSKNLSFNKVAVIDIETTGLDPVTDLIIEIGIVELNLETGETRILFDSFVKEAEFGEDYKDSWIFSNSDITVKDIRDAPLFSTVKETISTIIEKYPITAFNKSFDLGFLKIRGINIVNDLPCIMRTATDICRIQFPNGGRGYKWPKCQEAWDFFFPNSDYIEKHRAADDAIHEAKILYELYIRGLFPI